jgi:hypothetical protein
MAKAQVGSASTSRGYKATPQRSGSGGRGDPWDEGRPAVRRVLQPRSSERSK